MPNSRPIEAIITRMNATWTRYMYRDETITKGQVAARLSYDYPHLRDYALNLAERVTQLEAEQVRNERRRETWDDMARAIRAVDDAFKPAEHRTAEQNTAIVECQRAREKVDEAEEAWRYDVMGAMRGEL